MKWMKPILISLFFLFVNLMPISSAQAIDLSGSGLRWEPGKQALRRIVTAEVQRMDRGMIFVRTEEGTTRSFSVEEAKKEGIAWAQKGDRLTLEIDEGNLIVDIHRQEPLARNIQSFGKTAAGHDHQMMMGVLDSFDPLDKKVAIRLEGGAARAFDVKVPVLTKLSSIRPGDWVALEIDEEGRVMDARRG